MKARERVVCSGPDCRPKLVVIPLGMATLTNHRVTETADLLVKIARCHRLAKEINDARAAQQMIALAAEYEGQLRELGDLRVAVLK